MCAYVECNLVGKLIENSILLKQIVDYMVRNFAQVFIWGENVKDGIPTDERKINNNSSSKDETQRMQNKDRESEPKTNRHNFSMSTIAKKSFVFCYTKQIFSLCLSVLPFRSLSFSLCLCHEQMHNFTSTFARIACVK